MNDPFGDMPVGDFRREAHRVADVVADYLEHLEEFDVLPRIRPGEVRAHLQDAPPEDGEPLETILADYRRWIEPNVTHWQHPGFMAYFPSVASGPGILGEWLAAGLNSNVMFWRNAPASTEVEQTVVEWLRGMLGLPDTLDGMLTDTASISSLLSVVAARNAVPGLESRTQGLAGRPEIGRLRMYASSEAHMSIDKSAIVAGVGTEGVRRISTDAEFAMRPDALAAAIAEDRRDGWLPFCVVGTLGTTGCNGIDPAAALADICERERLWLHLDAAYGGIAALCEEKRSLFAGWERADSLIVNPHKWMFTPFDASLLLFKDAEAYRSAFSIVPEYLSGSTVDAARNYSELGLQLGRRFRALKLWMQIRYFGRKGIADRIREHCRLAATFAEWVDAAPDWERTAPVPFGLVCLRYRPEGEADERRLAALNRRILERTNAGREVYLSHAESAGRYFLRVVVGNPRTGPHHVRRCWAILQEAAAAVHR